MLLNNIIVLVPVLFRMFCSAIPVTLSEATLQLNAPFVKSYQDDSDFASSETVYGIAEGLERLQSRNSGFRQLSQSTHEQIIKQDLVSTEFYSYSILFNLSVSGEIWGYTQKPGYYQFTDGTVSNDVSANDIGNDIALLDSQDLKDHILKAIDALNNLTYQYLDASICSGTQSLRQVLDPIRSSEAMTALIAKGPAGISIFLTTATQGAAPANTQAIAASAMAFVTIMNNGIIHRIFEQGWIDFVDAFIVEIYLALGNRIANRAEIFVDGDCVAPYDAVAGMNGLTSTLEDFMSADVHKQELQEL